MGDVLVLMEGIEKRFPGVQAISSGRFELRAGEVHALCGENGAGKSTMMNLLAGIFPKDAGRIVYLGNEIHLTSPHQAIELGISMIHQELNLMPHLTVAENIFIGREPRRAFGLWLDDNALNAQAQQLFDQMHLKLNPRQKVGELTVAKQQLVEIARALSLNAKVLIMDEPTAALTESEIEDLFQIIRQLRDKGTGIVHISHRLEEIKQITDRVTVMRDGRYIDTLETKDVSIDQIISMMVGRTLYETTPAIPEHPNSEIALEVKGLNRGRSIRNVSFQLRRGEILGVAGLVGAGRTEVARAVFGADPIDSGEILLKGQPVRIRSPHDAVKHGIGYLSEDRKRFGLALNMDVEANTVLAALTKFLGSFGLLQHSKTRAQAEESVRNLAIKTPSVQQRVRNLSGGNQQKVVIGKWLTANTDILIFDEPTRGIDVGAKSEIYRLINDLAQQGKAIMMISSELPEILRMSHRILVMCEGRISGELAGGSATQEQIMAYATQREAAI